MKLHRIAKPNQENMYNTRTKARCLKRRFEDLDPLFEKPFHGSQGFYSATHNPVNSRSFVYADGTANHLDALRKDSMIPMDLWPKHVQTVRLTGIPPGKKQEAKNFFQNRLHWTSNRHHWQTRMEAKQAFYWTIIPKVSQLTNENADKCENVADKARTIPPA